MVKNLSANEGDTGDLGSVPGLGRSPGIGNGNPLQRSCLENPTDRGVWQATVHGVAKVGRDQACMHTDTERGLFTNSKRLLSLSLKKFE